jgi:hypothetical protein
MIDINFRSFRDNFTGSNLSENLLDNEAFLLFLIIKYDYFIENNYYKIPDKYKNNRSLWKYITIYITIYIT